MFEKKTTPNLSKFAALLGTLSEKWEDPPEARWHEFDLSHWSDVTRPPTEDFRLFGCEEKMIGRPAELFSVGRDGPALSGPTRALMRGWQEMLESLKTFNPRGQVAGTQSYVNGMADPAPVAGLVLRKAWTTPLALLLRGSDTGYRSLAKYVSLRFLGFHGDRLRLVCARPNGTAGHDVSLAVALGGQAYVMSERENEVIPDQFLSAVRPLFSLNGSRLSVHWNPASGETAASAVSTLTRMFKGADA